MKNMSRKRLATKTPRHKVKKRRTEDGGKEKRTRITSPLIYQFTNLPILHSTTHPFYNLLF
jgi:hypothetical protein